MTTETQSKETGMRVIPSDWEEISFSEAVEINPKRELGKNSIAKSVSMADIQPFTRRISNCVPRKFKGGSKFKNGDTLFARITPCLENGKTAFVDILDDGEVGFGSTEFIVLAAKEGKTDPYFVYYLSLSPDVRNIAIKSMTGTSGRQRVENDVFDGIITCLPPLKEQSAIAKNLSDLDFKIELNQQMNKTLEAISKTIFKHWFTDFEFPSEEGKPYKSSGGEMEYSKELGKEIPNGWRVVPLSELTTVITKGTTPTQKEIDTAPEGEAQVNYVRVNAITEDGAILFDKLTRLPESLHLGALKRSVLHANDVLYTIAGSIGRISIVEQSLLPANTNQAVAIIRPKPTIPSNFLVLTMRQAAFREELHSNIVQAVQANLSLGMLARAMLVVPPKDVMTEVFKPIDDLMKRIGTNRTESRTLASLRDVLLPKLMSGKIRVPVEAR